jgi:hypothetical protein
MPVNFRVELIWEGEASAGDAASIFLTSDGRVILQGRGISADEREAMKLPRDADLISVDRNLISAIKDML